MTDGLETDGDRPDSPLAGNGWRRRRVLQAIGLVGVGGGLGYGLTRAQSGDLPDCRPAAADHEDASFWLGSSSLLQDRPLYSLCLPGTHHASFPELTANWASADWLTRGGVERWTRPQSKPVATQLRDGIRYLDIRPAVDPTDEHTFWGHHELARGAPLERLFDAVGEFLADADADAQGNELVICKLSHFEGFDAEAVAAFDSLLREHLEPWALQLPDRDPESLLAESPGDLDGSRVMVLSDEDALWPDVVDSVSRWLGDGWLNESELETLHAAASEHTHTSRTRFGRTDYYITPTTARIALAETVGRVPLVRSGLAYRSLADAARQLAAAFPCYVAQVYADEQLNPNVIPVDFYEEMGVVTACRQLSRFGLHGTGPDTPS